MDMAEAAGDHRGQAARHLVQAVEVAVAEVVVAEVVVAADQAADPVGMEVNHLNRVPPE